MKINIIPDKPEYYPGENLTGKIKLTLDRRTSIKDIEMSLYFAEDWNHLCPNNKYEASNNTQCISVFCLGLNYHFNKPSNSIIDLEPKEYTFPFLEKLPEYLLPSFEFPQKEFRAFLRYTLTAKTVSSNPSASSTIFLIINSNPKKEEDKPSHKYEKFNKGQTGVKVFLLTKNYKITDTIPVEIEIDNLNCKLKLNECKLKLNRKIIFRDKEDFSEKYSQEDKIVKKVFKITVNKKEKKTFNFDLDLKKISYKGFNYDGFTNPYFKENKQYSDLLSSFDGNIINCHYTLIIKLKYSNRVSKEDRPILSIPIFIVHKLDDDHHEQFKNDLERIKENEKNKIDAKIINDFEVLKIDNEEKEKENINNNINDDNNNINKKEENIVENIYDKINLDFNNYNQNNQNNQNDKNNQINLNNKNDDDYDLPSRDTLIRAYENKNNQNENQNNKVNDNNNDDDDGIGDIIDIDEYNDDDASTNTPNNNQNSKLDNNIKSNNNKNQINNNNNYKTTYLNNNFNNSNFPDNQNNNCINNQNTYFLNNQNILNNKINNNVIIQNNNCLNNQNNNFMNSQNHNFMNNQNNNFMNSQNHNFMNNQNNNFGNNQNNNFMNNQNNNFGNNQNNNFINNQNNNSMNNQNNNFMNNQNNNFMNNQNNYIKNQNNNFMDNQNNNFGNNNSINFQNNNYLNNQNNNFMNNINNQNNNFGNNNSINFQNNNSLNNNNFMNNQNNKFINNQNNNFGNNQINNIGDNQINNHNLFDYPTINTINRSIQQNNNVNSQNNYNNNSNINNQQQNNYDDINSI